MPRKQKTAEAPETAKPTFTKEQILNSRWFSHRRDILEVVLVDGEEYSHGDVDALLADFLKGGAN